MRIVLVLLGVLALAAAAGLALGPPRIDAALNRVVPGPGAGAPVPARARVLHAGLRVVDLHADPLLWSRDLLARNERGHVDLPRLRAGNVALQVFGVVTKSPWGQNYERTSGDSDRITALTVVQAWPPRTWTSLRARALHQAAKLRGFAARSEGGLLLVRSRADLEALLARRATGAETVGALLALEGLHPLEGELDAVDALFEAGFRMAAPTHFFDNRLAGAASGLEKGGLTPFGRDVIARMEALGMVVDLAHASPRAVEEVLARASEPVVVSHTGVQATCPGPRNLSDAQVRAVAAGGGGVGIGLWEGAVCGTDPRAAAAAMRHVRDLVGPEHVALGTDFDGTVTTALDASGLARLTQALLAEGFTEGEVRAALGGNALRVLSEVLP